MTVNWKDPNVKARTDEREGLPDVITPDYGIGITFTRDGIEYTSDTTFPRRLAVRVHSWTGISIGAVHYYAKIGVSGESFRYTDEEGKPQFSGLGGAWTKYTPKETHDFDISVKRPLTDAELHDGTMYDSDRWHGYDVGDLVDAFESELELYNAIVECLKARFAGEWLVDIDGFDREEFNIQEVPLAEVSFIEQTIRMK
jgi:hypothetical protein